MTNCQVFMNTFFSSKVPYYTFADTKFQQSMAINTGNILICNYGAKQWDYNLYFSNNFQLNQTMQIDKYIILAANILRPNSGLSFGKWSDFFETVKDPINILGVGAQCSLENMLPDEYAQTLSEDIVKWINIVSYKCNSIGVRGEFTADVLKCLGITNVDIIGCPTWFTKGYNQQIINKKEWINTLKPAFYTCWEPYSDWHTAWHHALLENALRLNDPKFIMQSEFNFVPYMIANKDPVQFMTHFKNEDFLNSAEAIKKHFGISEYDIYQNNKIKNMFEIFSDISDWEQLIKTRDFSFGFRIHGSIVALKNGVPAICVVSDSRMYEMCELFKIPYVRVDKIASDNFDIQKIYEEADFSELNRIYPKLLKNYINFLNKNNIQHKL